MAEYGADTCNNMDKPQKHYAKRKKPHTKDCIVYNSIDMICQKRQNYSDIKISGCHGLGWRDGNDCKGHMESFEMMKML